MTPWIYLSIIVLLHVETRNVVFLEKKPTRYILQSGLYDDVKGFTIYPSTAYLSLPKFTFYILQRAKHITHGLSISR